MYLQGLWPYWAFISTSNPFVLHEKTFLHFSSRRTTMERLVEAAALPTGRAVREVLSLLILKTVVQTWHRSDKLLALHGGVVLLQQPGGLLVHIALLPPRGHCLSTDPGHQKHPREPCWVIVLRAGIYRRLGGGGGWGGWVINGSFETCGWGQSWRRHLNVIYIGGMWAAATLNMAIDYTNITV